MFVKTSCLIILLTIVMMNSSCKKIRERGFVEAARIKSPDSRLDAIVVIDTTINRGMMVAIEHTGQTINDIDGYEFFADKVYALSVRWINSRLLKIHYKKGRIFKFSNIWTDQSFGPFMQVVEIKLIKDGEEKLDILHD